MDSGAVSPNIELLLRWSAGEQPCRDQLVTFVDRELRRIARRRIRHERAGHTLQTTALVNEAWLRLTDQSRADWQSREKFFGVAAGMMHWLKRKLAREAANAH
jgi:RNA polymerase sigma-70 factor (ECF subfamily)